MGMFVYPAIHENKHLVNAYKILRDFLGRLEEGKKCLGSRLMKFVCSLDLCLQAGDNAFELITTHMGETR